MIKKILLLPSPTNHPSPPMQTLSHVKFTRLVCFPSVFPAEIYSYKKTTSTLHLSYHLHRLGSHSFSQSLCTWAGLKTYKLATTTSNSTILLMTTAFFSVFPSHMLEWEITNGQWPCLSQLYHLLWLYLDGFPNPNKTNLLMRYSLKFHSVSLCNLLPSLHTLGAFLCTCIHSIFLTTTCSVPLTSIQYGLV